MDRLGSEPIPVVFVTPQRLTAFDAHDGHLLYCTPLGLTPAKSPMRVLRYRDDWVVALGKVVAWVDGSTGALTQKLSLPFAVRTALAQQGFLIFAGEGGTACYRDGELRWTTRHDWTTASVVNEKGAVTATLPLFTSQHIAIGMGSEVAQAEEP
jgi:hypothetical protein